MRSDPADFELIAPGTLHAVVSRLADEPGQWLPIAGGTDVMVQYAAGKLPARKLISIWNLTELQGIEILPDEIRIGAGCTYTELREHNVIAREFPLLASAARWTGGIANQNRGTLGGNIVNASPAADSLPALLAYEAELILVSVRGERRMRQCDFAEQSARRGHQVHRLRRNTGLVQQANEARRDQRRGAVMSRVHNTLSLSIERRAIAARERQNAV